MTKQTEYATDKEKGLLKVEIYIKFRTKNTVGKSRKNKKPKLYLQRIPYYSFGYGNNILRLRMHCFIA